MKIKMRAEDFKVITERAMVAAAKNSSISVMKSVLLIASDNKVIAKAYNFDHYAEITTDAVDVIEEGSIVIHRDNLKSLYTAKGTITIETADKTGIVRSTKKTSRFFIQDEELFPEVVIGETKQAFTIKQSELLAVMTKVKPYLAKNNAKPSLNGIGIEGTNGLGTFYGCDGLYCIRQKIHGNFNTFSIIVQEISKELKDVSGVKSNKQDCDITVAYSKKYVVYEGADFKFATRLFEGKYVNLETIFNSTFPCGFDVDTKEVYELAKEYKNILIHKTSTSRTINPMIFTNINGTLSAMAISNSIQTMDNLDTAKNVFMETNSIQGFNPNLVEIVMKTFEKGNIHIDSKQDMWKINGNTDCSVLLVAMRLDKDTVSKIHDFVQNVA